MHYIVDSVIEMRKMMYASEKEPEIARIADVTTVLVDPDTIDKYISIGERRMSGELSLFQFIVMMIKENCFIRASVGQTFILYDMQTLLKHFRNYYDFMGISDLRERFQIMSLLNEKIIA